VFLVDRRSCFAATQKIAMRPGSPVAFGISNTDLMYRPSPLPGSIR
jgi:molybdopterin biosynthesis enzyme